jgi:hypothetical protein
MKAYLNHFILIVIVGLLLGGCQEEVIEIIDPQNDNTISSESPVAALVQKTSMKDGSADNILDNSSCSTVVLPVTVIANGVEVIINSEEDFKLVERIFDESDTDDDILEFIYPIKVILADHTEVIVNNDDELEDLIEDCIEGGGDEDIECLDFKYPINISIYDGTNQVLDVVVIHNDEGLFNLFESLKNEGFVSFNFPLTLLVDGTEIVANDNSELEDLIEAFADDCDEDDDNDFNDDDIDDSELIAVLLDGEWAITFFFDDEDETAQFNGYVFTFFENRAATAAKDGMEVMGSWESYGDDGSLELELDFGPESPLDELEDDWDIIEFGEDIIILKDTSGDGSVEFLIFERPTGSGGGEPTLADLIVDGTWVVANYNDSGVDETANYAGFSFTFYQDNTVVASNGTDTINGTWEEIIDSGDHKLVLDMGLTVPFDEFAEDWDVVSYSETRIDLKDISGGDGSTDILVFEKI